MVNECARLDLTPLNKEEIAAIAHQHFPIPHDIRARRATLVEYVQSKANDELISDLVQSIDDKTYEKEVKSREKTEARKKQKSEAWAKQNLRRKTGDAKEEDDSTRYLELPTTDEVKASYSAFHKATSSTALALSICGVCARQRLEQDTHFATVPLTDIPNAHRLVPRVPHAAHDIYEGGILLLPEGVVDQVKDRPFLTLDHVAPRQGPQKIRTTGATRSIASLPT